MAGTVSVNGLISGLDTETIINQLLEVQTARVTQLQDQQAEQTNVISLFQQIQALYLSLRTASNTLTEPTLFEGKSTTSSDTTLLTAIASDTAALGSHTLTVKQLAAKNQFVSNRFEDTNVTTVGTGALNLTVGTGSGAVTTNLTVDNTNNTLDGVANLINNSGAKVSASIIKVDDSSTPYQLVVTATEGGTGNAVSITHDASLKNIVSGEVLGVGAATATQDTDDSNAKTYALRHLPNAGTTTVKLGGTAITASLGTVTLNSATTVAGTFGQANGNYSYVVSAVDASGETIHSSIKTANVTDNTTQKVRIDFNRISGASSYKIYRVSGIAADITPFLTGSNLVTTVADAGSGVNQTFDDTGAATTAGNPLTTATQGYTLTEATGAVAFNSAQTLTVTADYEYDLEFLESQTAQDAIIEFGSGANAITIRKSSNTISDVIEGLTLSLKKADAATPVIIDIKRNTLNVQGAVQAFVDALNEAEKFLDDQTFFDSETGTTGALFSDPNVFNIRNRVNGIATSAVSSIPLGEVRSLAEVGVTLNPDTGTYLLNTSTLSAALNSKAEEVRGLFSSLGTASDVDIKSLGITDDTKTSSASGYLVNITRAATQAEIVGAQDVTGGITTGETLTITDEKGTVTSVNLTSGMTAQSAVSAINSSLKSAGVTTVLASFNSATGKITLRHTTYGLSHFFKVKSNVGSGTAGSSGLGSATANAERTFTGQDVAGTINAESATGDGQVLTGDSGNANTAGLKLQVTLTPATLLSQGASQGTVRVSRGLAAQMEDFLKFLTDESQDGPIQSAIKEADDRIQDLQESIDTFTERSDRERERLLLEFGRLEQALGSLQSTSSFLDGQLKQFAATSEALARRRAGG